MKYSISLLLALSIIGLFSTPALALTFDEESLTQNGFSGIEINESSVTKCAPLTFTPFSGYLMDGNDTVLTLHVQALPLSEADANITITLPSNPPQTRTLFLRERIDNEIFHFIVPQDWQTSPTTLDICANGSLSTEKLTVSNEGMIGLYQQPHFDGFEDFQTYIVGKNPLLGQEIAVQVYVRNSGAQPANVKIDYRKYNLDYIPLLKGQTGFEGTIAAGEGKALTYTIKPLRSVQILLPPAVLTYTNIFGETITHESTRAYLDVAAPAFNVRGAFLVPQTQANVNEPLSVRWIAQNEGIAPISGLEARFFVRPTGTITPTTLRFDTLDPSRAENHDFTLTFSEPGKYELGCVLTTQTDATLKTNCESAMIDVVADTAWITWGFSILLLLVAIAVYVYIAVLPNRPRPPEPIKKRRFQT